MMDLPNDIAPNFPTSTTLPPDHYSDVTPQLDAKREAMYDGLVRTQRQDRPDSMSDFLHQNFQPNGAFDLASKADFPGKDDNGQTQYASYHNGLVTGDFLTHHLLGVGIAASSQYPQAALNPEDIKYGSPFPDNKIPANLSNAEALASGYKQYHGDTAWSQNTITQTDANTQPTQIAYIPFETRSSTTETFTSKPQKTSPQPIIPSSCHPGSSDFWNTPFQTQQPDNPNVLFLGDKDHLQIGPKYWDPTNHDKALDSPLFPWKGEAFEDITKNFQTSDQRPDGLNPFDAMWHWASAGGKPIEVPIQSIDWSRLEIHKTPEFQSVAQHAYQNTPNPDTSGGQGVLTGYISYDGIEYDPQRGTYSKIFPYLIPVGESLPETTLDGYTYGRIGAFLDRPQITIHPTSGDYEVYGTLHPPADVIEKLPRQNPKQFQLREDLTHLPQNAEATDNFGFNPAKFGERSILAEAVTRFVHQFPGTPFNIYAMGTMPYYKMGNLHKDLTPQQLQRYLGK